MDGMREFVAGPDDAGRRLDRIVRSLLGDAGLSSIYSALRKGLIKVNGRKAKADYRIAAGDRIALAAGLAASSTPPGGTQGFEVPAGSTPDRSKDRLEARARLGAMTVARSPGLLVLNKPRGLLTHGEASLDCLVKLATAELREASLAFSPAPLHRLDRNTSGLVAFSLSMDGARLFSAALREGLVSKTYLALLSGRLEGERLWEDSLARDGEAMKTHAAEGGQRAVTRAKPLLEAKDSCLAAISIGTGRTHQIRAQCSIHGHPLVGDGKYGGPASPFPYILHAWILDLRARSFEGMPALLEASLPAEAREILEGIFGASTLEKALEEERRSRNGA